MDHSNLIIHSHGIAETVTYIPVNVFNSPNVAMIS